MKKRQAYQLLLFVLLFSFVTEIWIGRLLSISRMERLHENTVMKMEFRDQQLVKNRSTVFVMIRAEGCRQESICWKASLAISRFHIHIQKKRFANERRRGNRKRHGALI